MGIAATPHKFPSASACQIPSGSEGKLNQSHAGEQSTDPPWGARCPHGERCCQLAVWWWPFRGQGHIVPGGGGHWQEIFVGVEPPSYVQPPKQPTATYFWDLVSLRWRTLCVCVCVCARACMRRGCPQLSSIAHNLCPYPRCSPDSMNSHPLHSSPRSRCSWSPVCSFGNRLIPPRPTWLCPLVIVAMFMLHKTKWKGTLLLGLPSWTICIIQTSLQWVSLLESAPPGKAGKNDFLLMRPHVSGAFLNRRN